MDILILVTLGTQDKSFTRLLDAVQRQIDLGNIKDEVIVQAGVTEYKSRNMKIKKLMPIKKLNKLIEECDLLITHGGVGSILSGLEHNKKVIAAARLKKYDKKTNYSIVELTIHEGKNHQVKRMFEALGFEVVKLKRETFSFLNLSGLTSGEYRNLTPKEVKILYSEVSK